MSPPRCRASRLVKLGRPLGAAINDLLTSATPRTFARWACGAIAAGRLPGGGGRGPAAGVWVYDRAEAAGVPVVYANDNFGRWRSDLSVVVERCLEPGCKGRPIAERLRPGKRDYFVLKPKHSAFFATTTDTLLRYLGTRTVVIGGFAADICVLFTAGDAYMRALRVVVPSGGVASNEAGDRDAALALMRRVLKASTPAAREIDFAALSAGEP